MNKFERLERDNLPPKYRPLGAWSYFGYMLLFSIPLIGFICLVVFAISDSNINRRSFARSYFCGILLLLIATAIVVALGFTAFPGIFDSISAWFSGFLPQ